MSAKSAGTMSAMSEHDVWMQQCIDLAKESATGGGGPSARSWYAEES